MEHELFVVERLAQLIFQGELAGHRFGHFLRVEQVALAARLGLLERGLGVLEQGVGVGAVIRKYRYADLGGDAEHGVVQAERMVQKSIHRFLEKPRHVAILPYFRQYQRQNGPHPIRASRLASPDVARQPLRHLPQERVAGRPAEAVVDVLEPLQIDQEHGKLVPAAGGAAHVLRHPLEKQACGSPAR